MTFLNELPLKRHVLLSNKQSNFRAVFAKRAEEKSLPQIPRELTFENFCTIVSTLSRYFRLFWMQFHSNNIDLDKVYSIYWAFYAKTTEKLQSIAENEEKISWNWYWESCSFVKCAILCKKLRLKACGFHLKYSILGHCLHELQKEMIYRRFRKKCR